VSGSDRDRGPADGWTPPPDPRAEAAEPAAVLQPPSIIDFGRTARRIRRVLASLAALVLVAWLAMGVFGTGGFEPRLLAEFLGLALLVAFLAEVVVVGGAAVRGMLRAGDRGDRLAGADVSLLPPQLTRRRRG